MAHIAANPKDAKMNLPPDTSKRKLFFAIILRAVGFIGAMSVILIALDRHFPPLAYPILSPAIHILVTGIVVFAVIKYLEAFLKRRR
jgi:hypothetical protein